MKSMKKLLQKAMVFTLAAAMVVGTPLTASAFNLTDLYSAGDRAVVGSGDDKPGSGDDKPGSGDDKPGTGDDKPDTGDDKPDTGSGDDSGSGAELGEGELLGIKITPEIVEINDAGEKPELTAEFTWADTLTQEKVAKLQELVLKNLTWASNDEDVVTVTPGATNDKVVLVPTGVGTANVTVNMHYVNEKTGAVIDATSDPAVVKVDVFATAVKIGDDVQEEGYTGSKITLADYVVAEVNGRPTASVSDTFSYVLYNANNKNVKSVATLKNGVLTIKNSKKAIGQSIYVKVIGTKASQQGWTKITVAAANGAKKIQFSGDDVKGNKLTWVRNAKDATEVTATVTPKGTGRCTDKIRWSSQNPDIVRVSETKAQALNEQGQTTITLTARKAGKAKITATASSGKKATLNVTVSADLTFIEINPDRVPKTLYAGQTVDLYDMVDQYFGNADNPKQNMNIADGGLKFKSAKSAAAKINANGVMTVKPDLKGESSILVTVSKKGKGALVSDATVTIPLSQVYVDSIIVTAEGESTPLLSVTTTNGKVSTYDKKITERINVGEQKRYTLAARLVDASGAEVTDPTIDMKSVLGWSASGNRKIVTTQRSSDAGVVTGVAGGKTATITVNGIANNNGKPKAVKVTFKMYVANPTSDITFNVDSGSIAMKYKGKTETPAKQNIKIKATLDKGSTTKATDIVWDAYKGDGDRNGITINQKNGTLTLAENGYALGDIITVTAQIKDTTLMRYLRFEVVNATDAPEITDPTTGQKLSNMTMSLSDGTKGEFVTKVVLEKDGAAYVPGDKENHVATVTYSTDKEGIVRVVDKGNGNVVVEPLAEGTVTVTATTSDGKTETLDVTVEK